MNQIFAGEGGERWCPAWLLQTELRAAPAPLHVSRGSQASICSGVLMSSSSPSSQGDGLAGDRKGWLRIGNMESVYALGESNFLQEIQGETL